MSCSGHWTCLNHLTFASETGYSRDRIFSFEDYNRFDTTPDVFNPGGWDDNHFDVVDQNGVFCDPQLGCTNRLAAGDLSQAHSRQFSQEFRLSSAFDGPFNFNLGANFLRYDTVEDYFVFVNTLTMWEAMLAHDEVGGLWQPGVTDNGRCFARNFYGPVDSDPNRFYEAFGCGYIDPNDIHHLNGQGRNYFLSRNPYHLASYAAFGEAYYQITPALKLTAGLRWTVDKKTAPQIPSWLLAGGNNFYVPEDGTYGLPARKIIHQEWREPTGRLALDWKPELSFTDETLVYGSYVRGYKAGGANPPPPVVVFATVCPPECGDSSDALVAASLTHPETFKPEFVNAYEIGTKNTVLDGRLTANLSAFYYDYTGYQISEIVDRSALNLNFDAKIWGAELELDWRPLENLRVGFKGGYENTRVADGMKAVDLMDRTAGHDGWFIVRPFPTLPSNCVAPTSLLLQAITMGICSAYAINVDPLTYQPYVPNSGGYDPTSAPNNGQGFDKDLSGHQLPNAPKFTSTITADYTLPLANDWLVTLHTDLYRQSEAWTRIFNDPGYDKLKAYTNVNVAAIFSNEDAGWQIMAYVKNVFNKDNITGAFLNSDDTGLTTNVFLNEPRLYGLRVTKNWSGGSWPLLQPSFPLTVEIGAQGQRTSAPTQGMTPFADAFSAALDPRTAEKVHFGWSGGRELRLVYHPQGSPWRIATGFRYGRTDRENAALRAQEVAGPRVCSAPFTGPYGGAGHRRCDPDGSNYHSFWFTTPYARMGNKVSRMEEHLVADFVVGRDVGIGLLDVAQRISGGLMVARFKSFASGDLVGVTDLHVPDGWAFARYFPGRPAYQSTLRHAAASFDGRQEFFGAGPVVSWDGSRDILGHEDGGRLSAEGSVAVGVLFGKQKGTTKGLGGDQEFVGAYPVYADGEWGTGGFLQLPAPTMGTINIRNSKSVTVPVVNLGVGLAYQIPGVKLGLGYRWERYFNVISTAADGASSQDRTIDGPYFKVSVGFGG